MAHKVSVHTMNIKKLAVHGHKITTLFYFVITKCFELIRAKPQSI